MRRPLEQWAGDRPSEGPARPVAGPEVRASRREGDPALRADMAHRRPCGIGGGLAFVAEAVRVPQARPQAGKRHHDGRCARRDRADLAHEDGDGAASEGPHLFDHEMGHRAELHREQPGKRRRRGSSTAGYNPATASSSPTPPGGRDSTADGARIERQSRREAVVRVCHPDGKSCMAHGRNHTDAGLVVSAGGL